MARYYARAVGDQARYDATRIGRQSIKAEINSWIAGMQVEVNSISKDPYEDVFTFKFTRGSKSGDHGVWEVMTISAKDMIELMTNDRVSLMNLYLRGKKH